MKYQSNVAHLLCKMSQETFDDRYTTEVWLEGMPSICAMETDLHVYNATNELVPLKKQTNRKCLANCEPWCPTYNLTMYDISSITRSTNKDVGSVGVDGKEVFPPDSDFKIPPKCIGELGVRVRRFDFRDPAHIGALIFSTGSKRHNAAFKHDGLVILPNHNFIGEFSSEIGPTISVYNSTEAALRYGTNYKYPEASPVGVLFEHLPSETTFEPVTVENYPEKITIPAGSKKTVQLVHARYSSPQGSTRINHSSLFYTSIGACEIPEGVFTDDLSNEQGQLSIYNLMDTPREIIFREVEDGISGGGENFLGYSVKLQDSITLSAGKQSPTSLKLDLKNADFHAAWYCTPIKDYTVPGRLSIEIQLTRVKVTQDSQANMDHFYRTLQDASIWVMKYGGRGGGLKGSDTCTRQQTLRKGETCHCHSFELNVRCLAFGEE